MNISLEQSKKAFKKIMDVLLADWQEGVDYNALKREADILNKRIQSTNDELLQNVIKAATEVEKARKLHCTCPSFVLHYKGGCHCSRGTAISIAQTNFEKAVKTAQESSVIITSLKFTEKEETHGKRQKVRCIDS